MRDEDEIQRLMDCAADELADTENEPRHAREYLRGVRDALDWALDEDSDPLFD